VEHQRLIDYVVGQYAASGHARWQVRVELPSHRQAVELARQLRAEGRAVARRWKCVMLGAANQDEAMALAEAIAPQAPACAWMSTQAHAFVRFPRSQPWLAEVPFDLGGLTPAAGGSRRRLALDAGDGRGHDPADLFGLRRSAFAFG
jgi:hypothetical protein